MHSPRTQLTLTTCTAFAVHYYDDDDDDVQWFNVH